MSHRLETKGTGQGLVGSMPQQSFPSGIMDQMDISDSLGSTQIPLRESGDECAVQFAVPQAIFFS